MLLNARRMAVMTGGPERIVLVIEDITDRKRAEDALRESAARLAAALRAGKLGVYDYDLGSGRIQWDDTVRQIWGVSADEPVSYETFAAGILAEDMPAVRAGVEAALAPGGAGHYEAEYRVRDRATGEVRWVAADGDYSFDAGEPVRLVGTAVDITDRKRAALAVEESAAEYRALFELSGVGNVEVDASTGCFLRVNRKFCELVGYKEEELLAGISFLDLTHPDDRARNLEGLTRAEDEQAGSFEIEKRYVRKDGVAVWAHLISTNLRDADGRASRLLGSVTDITARRAGRGSDSPQRSVVLHDHRAGARRGVRGGCAASPHTGQSERDAHLCSGKAAHRKRFREGHARAVG